MLEKRKRNRSAGDLIRLRKFNNERGDFVNREYVRNKYEQESDLSEEVKRVWLTTKDAAIYLGKTVNAITLLVSRGILIKRKWNGRLYFKKSELDCLIDLPF